MQASVFEALSHETLPTMSDERRMLVAVIALAVLGLALRVVRSEKAGGSAVQPWAGESDQRLRWLGAAATLLASTPLLPLAPWVSGLPPAGFGDGVSHARVAAELSRTGLAYGWVDGYVGGFPLAIHYPITGWLAAAGLIRLGLSPLGATHLLGWLAIAATPLSFYVAIVRCGGRALFAWLGALFLAWVSPYNAFVGGYESFFEMGLLSQVLALPLCIAWVSAIVRARSCALPTVWGVAAVLTHPQLAFATLTVTALASLVAARRAVVLRCAESAAATLAIAAAVYGPGIATLQIPFGWPPNFGWRHLGFPPERLEIWLADGQLFDLRRPALLTHLAGTGLLALLLQSNRPAARAVVVAFLSILALSVSGRALESWEPFGAWFLAFLQPMRVLALAPVAASLVVCVALEESLPRLANAALRRLRAPVGLLVCAAPVLVVLLAALPARLDAVRGWHARLAALGARPGHEPAPDGCDPAAMRRWLVGLTGGSLWYSPDSYAPASQCMHQDALALSVRVPIAVVDAVGAHVGVLAAVAGHLDPVRAGSALRAEALGIEHAVVDASAEPPAGWRIDGRVGSAIQLWSLERPASRLGAGCVEEVWSGSDAALRQRVFTALEEPAGVDRLLSFTSLIELRQGTATERPAELAACDARSARFEVHRAERQAIEVTVTSDSPVDVVFRVTAFRGWRVTLDRTPVEPRVVAPGFPSVRVPAGRHRVRAEVDWLPGYWWAVAGAGLVVALLVTWRHRRTTESPTPLPARPPSTPPAPRES